MRLRAQINPHFLFNALTTIGYLIQTAPPKAFKTLMRLTALLRSVLRSEGEFTTLGRELEIVEAYLAIERARFEDRLLVRIDVPARTPVRASATAAVAAARRERRQAWRGAPACRWTGDGQRRRSSARRTTRYQLCASRCRIPAPARLTRRSQRGRQDGRGSAECRAPAGASVRAAASLAIHSSPGQGTTVDIRLPVPVWLEQPEAQVGS